jgi:hypothetical protein
MRLQKRAQVKLPGACVKAASRAAQHGVAKQDIVEVRDPLGNEYDYIVRVSLWPCYGDCVLKRCALEEGQVERGAQATEYLHAPSCTAEANGTAVILQLVSLTEAFTDQSDSSPIVDEHVHGGQSFAFYGHCDRLCTWCVVGKVPQSRVQ